MLTTDISGVCAAATIAKAEAEAWTESFERCQVVALLHLHTGAKRVERSMADAEAGIVARIVENLKLPCIYVFRHVCIAPDPP